MKKEMVDVRWYLIKQFVIVIAVVGIAEHIIQTLINYLIMPLVGRMFMSNGFADIEFHTMDFVFLLFFLLVELVIGLALRIMPGISYSGEWSRNQLSNILFPGKKIGWEAIELNQLFEFFAIMIGVMFLVILPYLLAAFYFARITNKHYQKIFDEQEVLRQEYEKKRNLMLSDIAHDLRTPITTVSGYAKALSDGMVKEPIKQQEYLDAISKKAVRMNDLIQLLFEYVKLDSEGFALHVEKIDLGELLRKNIALIYSDVEDAGMQLDISIPDEPCMVEADEMQISRVITNLITNAIRHNNEGTTIGIILRGEDDEYKLFIADTGEEIPEELRETLFDPFAVGDKSRASKGGTGLGLSIAKKIVEMHGWKLTLKTNIIDYTKAFLIEIE